MSFTYHRSVVRTLAHRLDDPAAFAAAIRRLGPKDG